MNILRNHCRHYLFGHPKYLRAILEVAKETKIYLWALRVWSLATTMRLIHAFDQSHLSPALHS